MAGETGRHRAAFEAWYAADRNFRKASESFAVSDRTLLNWSHRFGWQKRADSRDADAAERADREAVKRRAKMLDLSRRAGELMVSRGVERLQKFALESDGAALSAIVRGIEVWRTAEGLPSWLTAILTGDEAALEREYRQLDARRRAALAGDGDSTGEPPALAAASGNGRDGSL